MLGSQSDSTQLKDVERLCKLGCAVHLNWCFLWCLPATIARINRKQNLFRRVCLNSLNLGPSWTCDAGHIRSLQADASYRHALLDSPLATQACVKVLHHLFNDLHLRHLPTVATSHETASTSHDVHNKQKWQWTEMQHDANVARSSIGKKNSGVVARVKAQKMLFSLVKTPTKLSGFSGRATSPARPMGTLHISLVIWHLRVSLS